MIRLDSERERLDAEETQRLLFGEGGVNRLAPLSLAEELEHRRAKAEPHPFSKGPMPDFGTRRLGNLPATQSSLQSRNTVTASLHDQATAW